MRGSRTVMVSVAAMLIGLAGSADAQSPRDLPGKGIVTNPSGRNLVVRTSLPVVTAFGYTLGDRVCSIGVGSEFRATDADTVVNGEVWFRVSASAEALRNSIDCGSGNIEGWIVGRLKTGWAVRITEDTTVSFAAIADSLESALTVQSMDDEDSEGGYGVLFRYVLLTLGTLAGVGVLAVERAQSVKVKDWYTGIVAFEAVMLSLANVLFAALLLDTFVNQAEAGFIGQVVAAFAGPPWGFAVLGFVLSILLLKFVSFSRN